MKRLVSLIYLFIVAAILAACSDPEVPQLRRVHPDATIVAFGDSLTFGTGAKPNESYPAQLAEMTGLKIVNAGVPGDESSDGLKRIQAVLDQYKPALVILALGGNDSIRKRPKAQTKNNIIEIIRIIQAHQAEVVLLAPPSRQLGFNAPDFYEEIGEELHIPVNTTIMPSIFKETKYKSDYIHFNAAGYHLMAKKVAAYLRQTDAICPCGE